MALRALAHRHALALLPLVLLPAVGCGGGGGGGGGDTVTFSASAGVDRTAEPFETLELAGSISSGASPRWRQLSGPPVEFLGTTAAPTVRFVTPEDPGDIVLELSAIEGGQTRARDQVRVVVEVSATSGPSASLRRRILVNGGGEGRATRADHDASTQRLFVLDSVAETVLAFDVSNPESPVLAGFLLQPELRPGFVPGPAVDLVAEDGVLAVIHEGESRQVPGRVVFYDPLTSSSCRRSRRAPGRSTPTSPTTAASWSSRAPAISTPTRSRTPAARSRGSTSPAGIPLRSSRRSTPAR